VYAHEDNVVDLAFLEERQQLTPVIRDRVGRRVFNTLDLMRPRVRWSALSTGLARLAGARSVIGERRGEQCLSGLVPILPVNGHRRPDWSCLLRALAGR
jgi:hypothetical protein